MQELRATAAIARCLLPVRLRGVELQAIRRIAELTLTELARELDQELAPEMVSLWESEARTVDADIEKRIRLAVCQKIKDRVAGIKYDASMITRFNILDPWRRNSDYKVPPVVLQLTAVVRQSGSEEVAWADECPT